MNRFSETDLEQRLRTSLGTAPAADFDAWLHRHGDVVAYLDPGAARASRRRRRWIVRLSTAAVAAAALVALAVMFPSRQESSALAVEILDRATTVTWTWTTYERVYSRDGKRTWLHKRRSERAYQSPNRYRETRFDDDGSIRSVEIVDASTNKALHLDMKGKKATWGEPTNQYSTGGPFASVKEILTERPIEFAGQRDFHGTVANVFRYRRPNQFPAWKETVDIWLNAKNKELLRVCDPGLEGFDPEAEDAHPGTAEEDFSKGELLGSVQDHIVFNPQLDPDLFNQTPPEGFEVTVAPPRPTVNEAQMIEWLGATARFNDGMFYKDAHGFGYERYNEAATKDKKDRTETEKTFLDIHYPYLANGNGWVIPSFANEYTVGGRYRYLGAGARLGDAGRIVLFYKLRSTGKYRAVYGDLSVKDVEPEELPLPVDD
ncbi:MAG TPA: hypothetical protein VHD36_03975 [Pirellulales bacterium]|nr:hypothetical protein [Pirellulales bacterium]